MRPNFYPSQARKKRSSESRQCSATTVPSCLEPRCVRRNCFERRGGTARPSDDGVLRVHGRLLLQWRCRLRLWRCRSHVAPQTRASAVPSPPRLLSKHGAEPRAPHATKRPLRVTSGRPTVESCTQGVVSCVRGSSSLNMTRCLGEIHRSRLCAEFGNRGEKSRLSPEQTAVHSR